MDYYDNRRLLKDKLIEFPFLPYSELKLKDITPGEIKKMLDNLNEDEIKEIKNASEENKYFFDMLDQIYEDPNLILNIPRISKNIILNPPVYPSIVEFHLGNSCQFNCKFCFSRGELKKKDMYPKFNQYQPLDSYSIMRCINEIKELGCNRVYFSGGLETFNSNLVTDIIEKLNNMLIYVYSNGESINERTIDVLIKKVKRVRISLHAFKEDTFKNIQCPSFDTDKAKKMFDKVKDNIKSLLNLKKHEKSDIRIGLSFLLMPENKDELFQFIDYWQSEGIDFIDIARNILEDSKSTNSIIFPDEWEAIAKELSSNNYKNKNGKELLAVNRFKIQKKITKSKVCYAFLKKIVIDPYGDVWTCCLQAHPGYQRHNLYLGNIKEESIIYIIQKWERIFSPGDKMIEIEHCADCTDWEYNFNVALSKIIEDQKQGFNVFDHYFLKDKINIKEETINKLIANRIGIDKPDPRY